MLLRGAAALTIETKFALAFVPSSFSAHVSKMSTEHSAPVSTKGYVPSDTWTVLEDPRVTNA